MNQTEPDMEENKRASQNAPRGAIVVVSGSRSALSNAGEMSARKF